jgi:hypothetical protein
MILKTNLKTHTDRLNISKVPVDNVRVRILHTVIFWKKKQNVELEFKLKSITSNDAD